MPRLSSLLLVTLILTGCTSTSGLVSHHGQHDPASLAWGIVGISDVPTLDPALASDPTSIGLASLIYGGLVRMDRNLHVRPDGATRWTISHGGTLYTFYLQHNLRFADGTPVTAADFAAALRQALGPEGSAGTASFYLGLITHRRIVQHGAAHVVRGIAVLDPFRLQITLSRPAAYFLAELAFPASFVPVPTLYNRFGLSWTDHAAGFGPYFVRSWQHGRGLILQRNPYYYAGMPAFRRIVVHFYQQPRSAIAAYKRGALDLISGFQVGDILPQHLAGTRRVPALALDYLAFNTNRLPFHRLNARRAFAAIDPARIAVRTMGPTAFPPHGLLPTAFGISSTTWHPSAAPSVYLRQSRYGRHKRLPTVTFAVSRDPRIYSLALALQHEWQLKLGVTVNLRQLNPSNYGLVVDAHAFDVAIVRWGGDYPDAQDFLGTQLGTSTDNITGWSARRYDAAIRSSNLYHPLDNRRAALFHQAADIAVQKLPIVPLDQPALVAIIRPGLSGVALTPFGTIIGDWAQARIAD